MKTEKMQEILETVINENLDNCCGHSIEEIFEYLANLGFSKKEAFDFVDRNYLGDITWNDDDEPEANEKINTETGEGVFWKAYTEEEEDEEISEPSNKSTPIPDYFRLIEMLDKAKAPYTNFKKQRIIEIKEDYTAVDFCFDENFNLTEVAF